MKKLLTLLLFFLSSFVAFSQAPSSRSGSFVTAIDQYVRAGKLSGLAIYSDTLVFNGTNGLDSVGSQIYVRSGVNKGAWIREYNGVSQNHWVKGVSSYASTISILNDSSLTVCNAGVCDTIIVRTVTVSNFTVINDSTLLVCDAEGSCDTININPTPIAKSYTDSVKTVGNLIYYYINGGAHLGGVIAPDSSIYITSTQFYNTIDSFAIANNTTIYNIVDSLGLTKMDTAFSSSSATADTIIGVKGSDRFVIGVNYTHDGLISGGIVTYSGSGLTYDVTSATYRKNAVIYNSSSTSVPLAAADPTYDRVDLIVADTTGNIVAITGVASANPIVPQIDPTYGIILTQITVHAGDTTPTNLTIPIIYDENTEWATSAVNATVNFDNTANPFHLTKSASVTAASNNGYLQFTNSTTVNSTDYNTLKFYIRLNTVLNKRSNLSVIFYNGTTNVSNGIILGTGNGFNVNTIGTYQNISIPISDFNFSSSTFDRIRIVYNGTNFSSFYVDYVQLQAGIVNGGGTQDLNFVRNVFIGGNNLYESLNGVNQLITPIATPQSVHDSITAIPKDTLYAKGLIYFDGDTAKFHYDSAYVQIKYAGAAKDSSTWTDSTLITKAYLNQRIAAFVTSTTWGSITGTLSSQTDLQSALNAKLSNITGLVTAGTGVTLAGSGTSGSPYVVSSSGGGGGSATGVDSTNTATAAGQTVFSFPYTLTTYTVQKIVTRNGVTINPADYTVGSGSITFTGFTCDSGDKIRFIGIK